MGLLGILGRTRAHVPGDSANAQFPDRYVDLGYIILYYVPRRYLRTRAQMRCINGADCEHTYI